ncbi:quinol monooxygenase YgiN [Lachnotalea glycerini]|nr:putative quinol monooxygenase [Lachnotalea glycerini]PXV87711.1 quinol monooxygenase YgiN [Lachnotalea glycerini]
MIKVVAKQVIKADKIEEFLQAAKQLVQDTNQKDAGCISYDLYQDVSNSQVLTIIEEWENKESLDQHMKAEHFQKAMVVFKDFTEGEGEINLYQKLS